MNIYNEIANGSQLPLGVLVFIVWYKSFFPNKSYDEFYNTYLMLLFEAYTRSQQSKSFEESTIHTTPYSSRSNLPLFRNQINTHTLLERLYEYRWDRESFESPVNSSKDKVITIFKMVKVND